MKIEFCIESVKGAKAAQKYEASSVELCSELENDGLTPSEALITKCKSIYQGKIHIMIRPRTGDFVYSTKEINQMKKEISLAKKLNVNGVVFGVLNSKSEIDVKPTQLLASHAKMLGLSTTFHRAYDFCISPISSIEKLIELKFDRLLTSGQSSNAETGINLLNKIKKKVENKIEIIAASGINESNAHLFYEKVDGIHFTVHNKKKTIKDLDYINKYKIKKIKQLSNEL